MKTVKNELIQAIPVVGLDNKTGRQVDPEQEAYKNIINESFRMKKVFGHEGFAPSFSYKMLKEDGKIKTFLNVINDEAIKGKVMHALYEDLGGCRFTDGLLNLGSENLTAFVLSTSNDYALNFDTDPAKMKQLFALIGKKERLLYSVTIQEKLDHEATKKKILESVYGKEYLESLEGKSETEPSMRLWEHFFTESERKAIKEKVNTIKTGYQSIKTGFQKAKSIMKRSESVGLIEPVEKKQEVPAKTQQKTKARTFADVQVMFLLWTENLAKKDQFQRALVRWAAEIQGDTTLTITEFKPDLNKVMKGYVDPNQPAMCLYRRELIPLMWLPTVEQLGQDLHHEQKLKTEIPQIMMTDDLGSMPMARRMDTLDFISIPRPKTLMDWDDWVKVTLLSGGQGGGKSTFIINQILETFCVRSKNREEWRKYAKSVVAFDVADGKVFSKILSHIPEWLRDRVIILNHADFEHPIPVNFHDLLELNRKTLKIAGYESEIAEIEAQIMLDTLKDNSSTNSIERYLIGAFQASLVAGEGHILDAIRILRDEEYRKEIFTKLNEDHTDIKVELMEFEEDLQGNNGATTLRTIENRFAKIRKNPALMDCIAQPKNEDIDFWKWTNGDDNGPYLVLVYLPSSMPKLAYNYLFAHYFVKLWMLMKLRDSIEEEERQPVLVVVDEIHQIMNHRSVVNILVPMFKEPRKYRYRYLLSMHGFSSITGQQSNEIQASLEDNAPNLVMFKGGDDMFKKLGRMFTPYTITDYNNLAKMRYTALFKVSAGQKDRIFIAKLIEPPEMRLPIHRKVTSEEFRSIKNVFGRPVSEVRKKRNQLLSAIYKLKGGADQCQGPKENLGSTIAVRI